MANYDLTYEGSRVQNILDTGDELRDAGYIFRGEATPSTVPGTPTERVAYIGGPGTYTNFGGSITVGAGCICVFKYTGSAWSNQVINTGLSDAISSEATARQLGDSTLQGGINTVSAAITAINNAIGNGSVYAGIATPSSTPASGKVFYFAFTAGTYTNFNNLEVPQGINILKNNGSTWLLDSFSIIDDAPTQGSANLVKSGGVLNSIIQNGPAFDLSAYNAEGGVLATYADLSAALTALNALPADFKKGGMSVKFVQTSDNNYVQYRLKANAFTIDITQWERQLCEDDITKLLYSNPNIEMHNGLLNNDGTWTAVSSSSKHIIVPIKAGDSICIYGAVNWGVLKSYTLPTNGATVDYSSDSNFNSRKSGAAIFIAPSDAKYLVVGVLSSGTTLYLEGILINGYSILGNVRNNIDLKAAKAYGKELTYGFTPTVVANYSVDNDGNLVACSGITMNKITSSSISMDTKLRIQAFGSLFKVSFFNSTTNNSTTFIGSEVHYGSSIVDVPVSCKCLIITYVNSATITMAALLDDGEFRRFKEQGLTITSRLQFNVLRCIENIKILSNSVSNISITSFGKNDSNLFIRFVIGGTNRDITIPIQNNRQDIFAIVDNGVFIKAIIDTTMLINGVATSLDIAVSANPFTGYEKPDVDTAVYANELQFNSIAISDASYSIDPYSGNIFGFGNLSIVTLLGTDKGLKIKSSVETIFGFYTGTPSVGSYVKSTLIGDLKVLHPFVEYLIEIPASATKAYFDTAKDNLSVQRYSVTNSNLTKTFAAIRVNEESAKNHYVVPTTSNPVNYRINNDGSISADNTYTLQKYYLYGLDRKLKATKACKYAYYSTSSPSTSSLIGTVYSVAANTEVTIYSKDNAKYLCVSIEENGTAELYNDYDYVSEKINLQPYPLAIRKPIEELSSLPKSNGLLNFYKGTKKVSNLAVLDDMSIVYALTDGKVYRHTEQGDTLLMTIAGSDQWRGFFVTSQGKLLISPYHNTNSADSGIWMLNDAKTAFTQVHTFTDAGNEATIWTFAEDNYGNIFAGVYDQSNVARPYILKSTTSGTSWYQCVDFNETFHSTEMRHIHCVYYDKWNNTLYALVGEGDYNFKSKDAGRTWERFCLGLGKLTAMVATPTHRVFGVDMGVGSHQEPYSLGEMLSCRFMITNDDVNFFITDEFWSMSVFGMRISDVTGYMYAYTLIDAAVDNRNLFPPRTAITSETALEEWKASNPTRLVDWERYNAKFADIYPDDAIVPQHAAILVSKNGGQDWEIAYKMFASAAPKGFYTASEFYFGECIFGGVTDDNSGLVQGYPLCLSEERCGFTNGHADLSKTILNGNI